MSVNIYDGTNLIPIAGKTVPAPTPDYVDEQYSNTKQYYAGNTCISGNKRYECKVNCIGIAPPNSTYWKELSVSNQVSEINSPTLLWEKKTSTNYNSDFTLSIDLSSYKRIMIMMGVVFNADTNYSIGFTSEYCDISAMINNFTANDGYCNWISPCIRGTTFYGELYLTIKSSNKQLQRISCAVSSGTIIYKVYGVK